MPKNAAAAGLQIQPEQMEDLFMQSQKPKLPISPIGTGKPRAMTHFQQHQQQQQQAQQQHFNNFDQRQQNYNNFNKRKVQTKNVKSTTPVTRHQKQPEKPKQGPFNKVLIVGLAPEYRSLNGVLGKIFIFLFLYWSLGVKGRQIGKKW